MRRYTVVAFGYDGKAKHKLDDCPDIVSALCSMARNAAETNMKHMAVQAPNGTVLARYSFDGGL